MSDTIRLSTPDGTEVYEVPAGALCQYAAACGRPAVQMRRLPVLDAIGVCVDHTEHADLFTPLAKVHTYDVPNVGTVTVTFGAYVSSMGGRAYRLIIGGVIEAERYDYPADNTYTSPVAGVVVIGAVARLALHGGSPWRAPLLAWAEQPRD